MASKLQRYETAEGAMRWLEAELSMSTEARRVFLTELMPEALAGSGVELEVSGAGLTVQVAGGGYVFITVSRLEALILEALELAEQEAQLPRPRVYIDEHGYSRRN